MRCNLKLAPRYYGPYLIINKVGQVAYTLQLPANATIHPTVHVSQLKKHISPKLIANPNLPIMQVTGEPKLFPHSIQDSKLLPLNGELIPHLLVQWAPNQPLDATWEPVTTLSSRYPDF
ncbi:hypothetical protein ACHQM5_026524 [Ranunculus cassubicifolius]